jgi:hypothetical protein
LVMFPRCSLTIISQGHLNIIPPSRCTLNNPPRNPPYLALVFHRPIPISRRFQRHPMVLHILMHGVINPKLVGMATLVE